jgi:hypothetical protein
MEKKVTLKVKLFDKKTGQETDNLNHLNIIKEMIEDLIKEEFPEYDYNIKIYGEMIPIKR